MQQKHFNIIENALTKISCLCIRPNTVTVFFFIFFYRVKSGLMAE